MNVTKAAIHTTAMNPRGLVYSFTVTVLLPSAPVASASISTTRGRASDQEAIGGEMVILCAFLLLGDGRMVMEVKSMSERTALREAKEENEW